MRIQNVVMELEAIEAVRKEFEVNQVKTGGKLSQEGTEILGRLLSLYSALNVADIREHLASEIEHTEERKAA